MALETHTLMFSALAVGGRLTRAIPCYRLPSGNRWSHSKPRPKYRPSAWRYLFSHVPRIGGGPRKLQNCSVGYGWPSTSNPLRICRKPIQNRPSCAHTSHVENHLVFRFCCLTIPSLSLVSSCRSLVQAFALIDISVSSCSTNKPIDKTTESHHHLPPVCTLRSNGRLDEIS